MNEELLLLYDAVHSGDVDRVTNLLRLPYEDSEINWVYSTLIRRMGDLVFTRVPARRSRISIYIVISESSESTVPKPRGVLHREVRNVIPSLTHLVWAGRLLVERGADPRRHDGYGATLMSYASLVDDLNTVKMLENDVNSSDIDGRTPLHFASMGNSRDVAQYLLSRGADPGAMDVTGRTAVDYALIGGAHDVLDLLFRERRDLFKRDDLLLEASRLGDVHTVRMCVEAGVSLNVEDMDGTPLCIASVHGHLDVVKYLVESGADVNQFCRCMTPLNFASANGHLDVVKYLVESGADVNLVGDDDCDLAEPALLGALGSRRIDLVKYLLDHGADVRGKDKRRFYSVLYHSLIDSEPFITHLFLQRRCNMNENQYDGTLLVRALMSLNNLDVIRALVEHGARVGPWEVCTAAKYGQLEALKYLLDHLPVSVDHKDILDCALDMEYLFVDRTRMAEVVMAKLTLARRLMEMGVDPGDRKKLVRLAIRAGDTEMVRYLLRRGWLKPRDEYLHITARRGDVDTFRLLVETFSPDLNLKDEHGRTPLHYLAIKGRPDGVRFAIERGADVNAVDADGRTPLHYAARGGDLETMDLLVKAGADVNAEAMSGETPLAVSAGTGRTQVFNHLLKLGADVRLNWELTLRYAISGGNEEIINFVLAHGGPVRSELLRYAVLKNSFQAIKPLVARGADVNYRDDEWMTPLHLAVRRGDRLMIRYLLGAGANPNVKDVRGNTPLHYAVRRGDRESVRYLVMFGADVNAQDVRGNTPLHYAVRKARFEIISYLVMMGANVEVRNRDGDTPLSLALNSGRVDLLYALDRE